MERLIGRGHGMREKCGVFGAWLSGRTDAASVVYLGLYALQHRGQESAGIASSDGRSIFMHKGMGLVPKVFDGEALGRLPGYAAIGHVRYSTTGESEFMNAQPLLTRSRKGWMAIAHNGNLVNSDELARELEAAGAVFQSTLDTELLAHVIASSPEDSLEASVMHAMRRADGAYSVAVLTPDRLVAFRDPSGVRPLCLGRLAEGFVVSSESCALDTVGAEFWREVAPGEMVVVGPGPDQVKSVQALPSPRSALCVFEFVYFARPDSNIMGRNVHMTRKNLGRRLAQESGVEADLVIAAPDSGTCAAIGYSEESGIPFDVGLARNRYVGRTFIEPTQDMRELGVRIKLNPVRALVSGKRIVMVDDSIVRGTTSGKTVKMLRDAGAREVHVRIASPPIPFPCFYGIDTSVKGQLIASRKSVDEIREDVGADSLAYLSLDGLTAAVGVGAGELCRACFNSDYPIRLGRRALAEVEGTGTAQDQGAAPRPRAGGVESRCAALG